MLVAEELVRGWIDNTGFLGAQLFVADTNTVMADLAVGECAPGRAAATTDEGRLYCAVKPFLACCIARAVDEGRADFEDPIAKYLPEFSAAAERGITLRSLLSHASGLFDHVADPAVMDFRKIVKAVCRYRAPEASWYRRPYYNEVTSWSCLAVAIERIFATEISEVVNQTMSRTGSSLHMAYQDRTDYVYPYVVRGDSCYPVPEPPASALVGHANPAHGGVGSARGLGLFYAEMLRCLRGSGRLMSAETAREMTRAHAAVEFGPGMGRHSYGLGFTVDVRSEGIAGNWSSATFGHAGFIGRYRVIHGFADPVQQIVVAARFFSVDLRNNWRFMNGFGVNDLVPRSWEIASPSFIKRQLFLKSTLKKRAATTICCTGSAKPWMTR